MRFAPLSSSTTLVCNLSCSMLNCSPGNGNNSLGSSIAALPAPALSVCGALAACAPNSASMAAQQRMPCTSRNTGDADCRPPFEFIGRPLIYQACRSKTIEDDFPPKSNPQSPLQTL